MKKGPKYQNLAYIIRRNNEENLYSDGHMLETENEFVKKYEMRRQTVRQALRLLEAELVQNNFSMKARGKGLWAGSTNRC